ncbi:MAG: hypothetical protein WA931_18945 [Rhodococcus sp. (in: high G+C Gram-positive bacteria)]
MSKQSSDTPSTIHLVLAIGDANTAVTVDNDGNAELFECPTSVSLDDNGRVELDDTNLGTRGFVSAVGDPRGFALASGQVVRAEDLVAGFACTLTQLMSQLYALPAAARCTVLHPASLSPEAVGSLREALNYVGLTECTLAVMAHDDVAASARAASRGSSSASTSQASDAAFAAMIADSVGPRTGRSTSGSTARSIGLRGGRSATPTRAAVAIAAAAFTLLAVGGAVGTRSSDPGTVAPLNSQQAIPPAAPVITSDLPSSPLPTPPPPVEEAPSPESIPEPAAPVEPLYVDIPAPVVESPPPAPEEPSGGLGLPLDRFPFAPPQINFPDFPEFPAPTSPEPESTSPDATSEASSAAPTTSESATSSATGPIGVPRIGSRFPVSGP